MVEAWRERHDNPLEIGLGLQDLFAGRDTRRAGAAAFSLADAIERIRASNPNFKEAKEIARKRRK